MLDGEKKAIDAIQFQWIFLTDKTEWDPERDQKRGLERGAISVYFFSIEKKPSSEHI